jgi:hypothetical protein
VRALAELRVGQCSTSIDAMFRRCVGRELPTHDGIEPTQLYATRKEVAQENAQKMAALTTEAHEFKAIDTGEVCFIIA